MAEEDAPQWNPVQDNMYNEVALKPKKKRVNVDYSVIFRLGGFNSGFASENGLHKAGTRNGIHNFKCARSGCPFVCRVVFDPTLNGFFREQPGEDDELKRGEHSHAPEQASTRGLTTEQKAWATSLYEGGSTTAGKIIASMKRQASSGVGAPEGVAVPPSEKLKNWLFHNKKISLPGGGVLGAMPTVETLGAFARSEGRTALEAKKGRPLSPSSHGRSTRLLTWSTVTTLRL
jgi:hypothetical protein